jgi:DNA mismatch repair protein MSH4
MLSGIEFINQLCVEDDERAATILAASNKYIPSPSFSNFHSLDADRYYALSAACALFKHSECRFNTRYAAFSLRIRYVPIEGTMMIDPDTARNLELVGNMAHKKSTHSLFGMLGHTWTAMASRLLRVNILSPITGEYFSNLGYFYWYFILFYFDSAVQSAIDARLDVVEGNFSNSMFTLLWLGFNKNQNSCRPKTDSLTLKMLSGL